MSKKIFVVEDDALTAELLERYIAEMGYQFSGAADNGEDALEQIRQANPDLVLMDIRLKGKMDGIQAVARLHETNSTLAVIYLTAYADNSLLERAKLTEPLGYLLKPFTQQNLKASIEMVLYKSEVEVERAKHSDEMRRLNAVLIGRENRVRELKREVNEVLREAGQPIRYQSTE